MANLFAILVVIGTAVSLGASDDGRKHYVELCNSKPDLQCVRNYFKDHASCDVVNKAEDSYLSDGILPFGVAELGLTAVSTNMQMNNLNGDIQAFYQDEKSGDLVIAVKFEQLACAVPDAFFAIAQDGQEPYVFSEYANITYPPVVITAVIPGFDQITSKSLEHGVYTAYIEDTDANIALGPKFTQSDKPVVQQLLKKLATTVPLVIQEIFLYKAQYYFLSYLQESICDFKSPLYFGTYDLTVFKSIEGQNTEDESAYEEPCHGSGNMKSCVRSYFAKHSSCSPVSQDSHKPVTRAQKIAHVQSVNVTDITRDAELTVNGDIVNFYIDGNTNNLVMTTEFDRIIIDAPVLDVFLTQKGREPKYIKTSFKATYAVRITVVIPTGNGINADALKAAYTSSLITSDPTFEFGSNLQDLNDEQLNKVLAMVAKNPTLVAQESFIEEGPAYFLAYLQNHICDFGLPLSDSYENYYF